MQFLRTLFWVIVAVAMLIFAVQNNALVTVNLWGGLQADVKIWLLALGPLLLGFLPTWILGRVSLWNQRREASAAAQRAMQASYVTQMAEPAAPSHGPEPAKVAVGAAPTGAPPTRIDVGPEGAAVSWRSSKL